MSNGDVGKEDPVGRENPDRTDKNKELWANKSAEEKEEEWKRIRPVTEQVGREIAEFQGFTGPDIDQFGKLYADNVRGFLEVSPRVLLEKTEPGKGRWPEEQALFDFISRKALDKVEVQDLVDLKPKIYEN